MPRTRIKIDGITRVDDALAAANAGADAIGMIFHPPVKRNISLDTAKQIVNALPPFVTPLCVFVDTFVDHILLTCSSLGIRHVQLHGNESPEFVAELSDFTVIKALKVEPTKFAKTLGAWREKIATLNLTHLQGFVLETATAAPGGTGIENNWTEAQSALHANDWPSRPKIIAAGGLTPLNVAAVVRSLRPYAVDVSTGVEDEPGKKSPAKIQSFISEVRRADAS